MKILEVIVAHDLADRVVDIARQHQAMDIWQIPQGTDERVVVRVLIAAELVQDMLDALQAAISEDRLRVVVMPVEATVPRRTEEQSAEVKSSSSAISREELYVDVENNARIDSNFLLLVFLSTIVAAVGLIEDNVAVVIGAMVIAPLLGPNIALALGTALGDTYLMGRALLTNLAGIALAIVLSFFIGLFWPVSLDSMELLSRTDVGLESVALALASGAAAVLSITTRLPSVLVGVMVAVALLPPSATFGLMLGGGDLQHAIGAGLLLLVNIVCVNLAAKLVFLLRGVRPRTWLEKRQARQSMTAYLSFWAVSLAVLIAVIYIRN